LWPATCVQNPDTAADSTSNTQNRANEGSVEHVEIFYTRDEATGDDWREKNAAMWKQIFVEDLFVVEGLQKGRHASGFDGGKHARLLARGRDE